MCWIAMSFLFVPDAYTSYHKVVSRRLPTHFKICKQIATEAKKQRVDPVLAISISFYETGFTNHRSPKGAQGPMGVMPQYHCPKRGKCDYIKAGVSALKKCLARRKDTCEALALYNRGFKGRCTSPRSEYFYAKRVLRMVERIRTFTGG